MSGVENRPVTWFYVAWDGPGTHSGANMIPFENGFDFYFAQLYLEKELGHVCVITYIVEASAAQVSQFARYVEKVHRAKTGSAPKHPFSIIKGGKA